MVSNSREAAFQFVHSSDGSVPEKGSIRTQIRRQAMSRVAATRKQKGDYGKHNLRQYPILVEAAERNESDVNHYQRSIDLPWCQAKDLHDGQLDEIQCASAKNESQDPVRLLIPPEVIPASISYKGYDSMRVIYGFDILDLSSLTSFHCGRLTAQALTVQPSRLASILRCQQWSYFSYLPSRYGHSTFLDDAVACVAARVGQLVSGSSEHLNGAVFSLYSRALRSLQGALDNPKLWTEPDVLCTIEVLALYELLDQSRCFAWIKHAVGATRLIKLRGPENYNTDYEKALFLAHVGPIYTEAFLNNTSCILEEESWKTVLRSVVVKQYSFCGRSEIVILLWLIIGAIPGIFKEVTDAICYSTILESHEANRLTVRIRQLQKQLSQWHQEYEKLVLGTHSQEVPGDKETDKRFEILGIYITSLIKLNRVILALNPLRDSRLEDETQHLACLMIRLETTANAANPRAAIFMAAKKRVAEATIATEEDWRNSTSTENGKKCMGPNGLIKKQTFGRWSKLMGRKTS